VRPVDALHLVHTFEAGQAVVVITLCAESCSQVILTLGAVDCEKVVGVVNFVHLSLKDSTLHDQEGLSEQLDLEVSIQGNVNLIHGLFQRSLSVIDSQEINGAALPDFDIVLVVVMNDLIDFLFLFIGQLLL